MTRTAVFPGSFDPITNAHLDVARRAAGLFDRLVIGVLDNPAKQAVFTAAQRVDLIRACVADLGEAVRVEAFSGLTVEFARRHEARFVVRGLRAVSDFEFELQLAHTNRRLAPEVDTTFLMTALEYGYISSSLAKEVARFGGDVSGMVPPPVEKALRARARAAAGTAGRTTPAR
jgi:pantetheine-phosphate adenylyltransferase